MIPAFLVAAFSAQTLPPLHTVGEKLVDPRGKAVTLKGCNLGNWLIQEFWMMGMPGVDPDQYGFEAQLAERFGEPKKDLIMEAFRAAWMTDRDWKIVQSYKFNLIRLPLNYRMFESDDQPKQLRPNAFRWVDKAVAEAERHGMYVILDLHGVQGGQTENDHTGRRGQNKVWTDLSNQDRAVWLWEQIAGRYKNRSAVVAYDLFNEPYGGTKDQQVALFKRLYPAVRKVDTKKLIFAHGNYDDYGHYGDPKKNGWTNVGFQMHYYPGLFGGGAPVPVTHARHLQALESVEARQNELNVPFLVGEFNVVLDAAGGAPMMRRYYDLYAKNGWMATMWSYKVYSGDGGTRDSWGMAANAGRSRRIDPATSTFDEMMAWAKGFATDRLAVNEPLRQMLTAKNPKLAPLPEITRPLAKAPADMTYPGWTNEGIGNPMRGGLRVAGDRLELYGAGNDIWGTSDSFQFLSQPVSEDFEIEVGLDSLLDTGSYAKAGLMVRATNDANSPFVMISAFPSGELQLASRATVGGEASGPNSTKSWKFGDRLRLRGADGMVTASYEANGTWVDLGKIPWTFGSGRAGAVSLSHQPDGLTRAAFRGLRLTAR